MDLHFQYFSILRLNSVELYEYSDPHYFFILGIGDRYSLPASSCVLTEASKVKNRLVQNTKF